MKPGTQRLVLFDIDGTLLSAGRASREALMAALEEVCPGGFCLEGYDFSGKTDPQIVRELLAGTLEAGRIEALLPRALDLYLGHLGRGLTAEMVAVKRGAAELLARLSADPRFTLGLLTGNHERGARIKLEPPGFNPYFPFGAFGSDSADRYLLPAVAVSRARAATGREHRGKEIVVIGDSIHDVACGRSIGVKAIAVASGLTPAAALAREQPDFLFDHLGDLDAVAEAIAA